MAELAKEFHGVVAMMLHGLTSLPFWLAVAGLATRLVSLHRPARTCRACCASGRGCWSPSSMEKYGFDGFNDWFFAGGARRVGTGLWKGGDVAVIDGVIVNGSARAVGWFARVIRYLQSGYIYHYAFAMIIGVLVLLTMVFIG